jgi:hypothetical protein
MLVQAICLEADSDDRLSIGSMQQCPDTAGTRVGRAYTTRTAGIQA